MTSMPSMINRLQCAQLLKEIKGNVLKDWLVRCKEDVEAANSQKIVGLLDTVPGFIDQLILTLEKHKPIETAYKSIKVAWEHAFDRSKASAYNLEQVIHEYQLLREVLMAQLNQQHILDLEASRVLHAFLDQGIRSAAERFSSLELSDIKESRNSAWKASQDSEMKVMRSRLAEEQIFSYFSQVPFPMCIVEGPTHVYKLANKAYSQFFARNVVGKTFEESFSEEEKALSLKILNRVYQTGESFDGTEASISLLDKNQQLIHRYIDFGYHPLKDHQGNILGVIVYIFDVTEQFNEKNRAKKNQRLLALERFKLEAIFNKSPAAMALWRGADLIFEKVNPEYQMFFGDRELIGKPFLDAVPELSGQGFEKKLKQVFLTGKPFVGRENLAQHKRSESGEIEDRYYDFTYEQIKDPDGQPYGVYDHAVDVTERVRAFIELEEQRAELESFVAELKDERELRERFVSTLTHDLRTPLTTVRMNAQMVRKKLNVQDSGLDAMLGRIISGVDRADRMIRDLLDANRIKAGEGFPVSLEIHDVHEIIYTLIHGLKNEYGDRFHFEQELGVAHTGEWDLDGLQRVLENLAGNAIKYGDINAPLSISFKTSDKELEIRVHNYGKPIPSEDQKTLFDQYKRGRSFDPSKQKGWGIGLALVKGLVSAHHGRVSVESTTQAGTTFIVCLPLNTKLS